MKQLKMNHLLTDHLQDAKASPKNITATGKMQLYCNSDSLGQSTANSFGSNKSTFNDLHSFPDKAQIYSFAMCHIVN